MKEIKKPRFYMSDLNNYTDDFLREIIIWQDKELKEKEKKWNQWINENSNFYLENKKRFKKLDGN
ncbi:MAG: hypothetical protein M0R17_05730 [Candidatus Omnitrophica bacterium]|jgi:hypothetical protein|nr:hypothetical protein [Candidatus Omnitrophota bacterium]